LAAWAAMWFQILGFNFPTFASVPFWRKNQHGNFLPNSNLINKIKHASACVDYDSNIQKFSILACIQDSEISSFLLVYQMLQPQRFCLFARFQVGFDRRKDPLGVAFLSHWGAEEEV
jgi:hypothetical protein